MNPKTDTLYVQKEICVSQRLNFNRKLERSNMPLLIVKFDGIIGTFHKEELFSDT